LIWFDERPVRPGRWLVADPQTILAEAVGRAIDAAFGADASGADPVVRPAGSARFGDYQANFAMPLGKRLDRPPRAVAEAVVEILDLSGVCETVEVAGPGFVNLTLDRGWLGSQTSLLTADTRLGVGMDEGERVVVDYSAPNAAKEMHVGHLRSTIIGDALCRVLGWLGHTVIRQNHLGDWGTPMGMLIEHMLDIGEETAANELSVGDLTDFYQRARVKFDSDPAFADRSRQRVVLLQSGDPETLRLWHILIDESKAYFAQVYSRLGVLLTDDDYAGESLYNDQLGPVCDELVSLGLAVIDDGALCVFPTGFVGRGGAPLPLIVRKSDGGFGYDATDLAALRYRTHELGGQRVIVLTDAGQSQHLAMIFEAGRMAGWLSTTGSSPRAEHVPFGLVLGPDGQKFKTRSGDSPKLIDLLDEAVARAATLTSDPNVAHAVGIGAVKYADLSTDRIKDYTFDWDRMMAFEGNTATYLQYAYVRVRSIFRKGAVEDGLADRVLIESAEERRLALTLLRFGSAVHAVAETLEPHRLCTYLFELAQAYTSFFEACPVLRAPSPSLRASRLVLCDLTARTLQTGLGLLGIETVEAM
jgi:arginyl-tRNA synthetase